MTTFEKVKGFLHELEVDILEEHAEDQIFCIDDQERGINHMWLDCEGEILVMEQYIFTVKDNKEQFKHLLRINRELIHGAFVLDDEGTRVIFRDTLQTENLDFNELEGSLNALSIALAEHADDFLAYAKA